MRSKARPIGGMRLSVAIPLAAGAVLLVLLYYTGVFSSLFGSGAPSRAEIDRVLETSLPSLSSCSREPIGGEVRLIADSSGTVFSINSFSNSCFKSSLEQITFPKTRPMTFLHLRFKVQLVDGQIAIQDNRFNFVAADWEVTDAEGLHRSTMKKYLEQGYQDVLYCAATHVFLPINVPEQPLSIHYSLDAEGRASKVIVGVITDTSGPYSMSPFRNCVIEAISTSIPHPRHKRDGTVKIRSQIRFTQTPIQS